MTVDQRREIIRKHSLSHKERPKALCQAHEGKLLEFYCEKCEEVICGQCLIDKHSVHGGCKYASEVLGVHVMGLKQILPQMEEAISNGERSLLDVQAESEKLQTSLHQSVSKVSDYFSSLREILSTKESSIVAKMHSQAKRKEKRIQSHAATLGLAVDAMKKTKLTVEDVTDRQAGEIDVLLEENALRARIQASLRLIEEEMVDCSKARKEEDFSGVSPFAPDPSVEAKCTSFEYSCEKKKRSQTTVEGVRGRADAIVGQSPVLRQRPLSYTVSDITLVSIPITTGGYGDNTTQD